MKPFRIDLTPIALALILVVGAHSFSNATVKSDESVVGAWKSYSVATFGATTAEFRADGSCLFREEGGEQFSCKWTQSGHGQIKIVASEPSKKGVFFAGLGSNRLVVSEPGREPHFVRADSKFAYERQLVAKANQ